MGKKGNESISAITSVAFSDRDWSLVSACPAGDARCSEDALPIREWTKSSKIEGSNGWDSEISDGGAVTRTSVLMASRNWRPDKLCGKA